MNSSLCSGLVVSATQQATPATLINTRIWASTHPPEMMRKTSTSTKTTTRGSGNNHSNSISSGGSGSSGGYSSFKWISTDIVHGKRHLHVNETDVNPMLNRLGAQPCNLISVFGRARQGKSFLM
jgi:hypothetical protein